jgi:hypothetical protein
VDPVALTIGSVLVLVAIATGAGLVLGVVRLLDRGAPPGDTDSFTSGEVRALLREERAGMRADFAEHVEKVAGVADTVKRHRKKAEAIEQAIDAREQELSPVDDLEGRRRELEVRAKSQGRL